MLSRIGFAVALSGLLLAPVSAQTVRFDTNVGTFDMVLNPMENDDLNGHVNNLLAHVISGQYNNIVVNRADDGIEANDRSDDFVLQLGGFGLESLLLPEEFDFPEVQGFGNVTVDSDNDGNVDFDVTNLNNTRGTVTLALQSGQPNSGSSSFFVNLGDNSTSLDAQGFVPFAEIQNMATVDLIMGLPQTSLEGGSLASSNIPVIRDNRIVYVERAFVLEDALQEAAENLQRQEDLAALAASGGIAQPLTSTSIVSQTSQPAALQALAVPEPPALVLALGALVLIYVMKPSKMR